MMLDRELLSGPISFERQVSAEILRFISRGLFDTPVLLLVRKCRRTFLPFSAISG